jgi:ribosomal protein S18 acetylase RimI-like enzyme
MKIERLENDRVEDVVRLSLRAWAPVFVSIERAMHPELYRRSYPDGWEKSQAEAVRDVCTSGECEVYTANDGEATLGFVAIKLDENSKLGEMYMIAVDPEHQGRGIASALTEFAVSRMKEAGMEVAMVETGADAGHEPARRTYEKAGFHPWPAVKFFKYL